MLSKQIVVRKTAQDKERQVFEIGPNAGNDEGTWQIKIQREHMVKSPSSSGKPAPKNYRPRARQDDRISSCNDRIYKRVHSHAWQERYRSASGRLRPPKRAKKANTVSDCRIISAVKV